MDPTAWAGALRLSTLCAHVLFPGAATLALALWLARVRFRRCPAARYTSTLGALICALTSPAIAAGLPSAAPRQGASERAERRLDTRDVDPPRAPAQAGGGELDTALGVAAAAIWLSGVGVGLGRRWRASRHVEAIARRLRIMADVKQSDRVEQAIRRIGEKASRAAPPTLVCPDLAVPCVVGIRAPVVLIPAALAERLDPDQLADVLLHEYGHVWMGHPWLQSGAGLLGAVLWLQPLSRAVGREAALAAEEICDNVVLQHRTARAYAGTLLAVAEEHSLSAAGDGYPGAQGVTGAGLRARVQGLLDPARERRIRPGVAAGLAVAILLAASTATSAAMRGAGSARPTPVHSAPGQLP